MLTEKIREEARKILEEGIAELVVGYGPGSLPYRNRLVAISSPEENPRLLWPSFGVLNPANVLHKLKGKKVALIGPSCTCRAVVVLLQEGQIKREDIYLVGVPCPGMLDPAKVKKAASRIEKIEDNFKDEVLIVTSDGNKIFERDKLLRNNCLECRHPEPTFYDVLIEAQARPPAESPYLGVEEIEGRDLTERWSWFKEEIVDRCLRCYACRNACPLCYCPTCFVDDSRPQWVGKTRDPVDTALYHLVRAYHLAGRCVDCGSCEAACPMEIPLRLLTKKLEKEALETFSFESGLDPESPLLFTTFKDEDPEDFMITHELKALGKI
jgi:ferredoxin